MQNNIYFKEKTTVLKSNDISLSFFKKFVYFVYPNQISDYYIKKLVRNIL